MFTNDFTAIAKSNKTKINVETTDDFRALIKILDLKKLKYYTYRLKIEKEISAIIRNMSPESRRFRCNNDY
jgi:hypothetical protein